MDLFTRFTREKTPQNNFSSQNFSVENNYLLLVPYGGSSLVVYNDSTAHPQNLIYYIRKPQFSTEK